MNAARRHATDVDVPQARARWTGDGLGPSLGETAVGDEENEMRLDDLPQSDNIEDRRGDSGGGGGGGFGMPAAAAGSASAPSWCSASSATRSGIDPRLLIGGAEIFSGGGQPQAPAPRGKTGAPSDDMGKFVAQSSAATDVAVEAHLRARPASAIARRRCDVHAARPRRCVRTGAVRDGTVLLPGRPEDLSRHLVLPRDRAALQRLRCRHRACKFAQAYVIAHEIGHHVQNQLGILPKVQQQQRGLSKAEANHLQVRVELQADCFAGVWAARADKQWQLIQPGDVEAAMRTAAAIGDDRLQKQAQGYVVPDSFTHGSSEQRQRWFQTGLKSGTSAPATPSRPTRSSDGVVPEAADAAIRDPYILSLDALA